MELKPQHPYDEKTVARFWAKVDKSGGTNACWTWTAYKNSQGYGIFTIKNPKRTVRANRVSLEITLGQLPPDSNACHRCDNPSCVNPAHLFAASQKENVEDGLKKGRMHQLQKPGERGLRAKLTEHQASEIRNRYVPGKTTMAQLSTEFGVTLRSIHGILRGETYKDAPGAHHNRLPNKNGENNGFHKLTAEEVLQIRASHRSVTDQQLSEIYRVKRSTISLARRRKTWKHVP